MHYFAILVLLEESFPRNALSTQVSSDVIKTHAERFWWIDSIPS